MNIEKLKRLAPCVWEIPQEGNMRVPGIIFADETLILEMDEKVREQTVNVATLPGIVRASFAMPDAHWGYGFPIGGVAAFDPAMGGVVSAGGVGFDVSCGVRTLLTGLAASQILAVQEELAQALFEEIPAGLGSKSAIRLSPLQMEEMLLGGARWAVSQGWGNAEDLERIEEGGAMSGARPEKISSHAKERQRAEMGTLGSGNHYLEVQVIEEIHEPEKAKTLGLVQGDAVVSIHCGSRGLGHQIGTDYLAQMARLASQFGIELADKELACAPIASPLGQDYLGAMRGAINCALANREILTHFTREVFSRFFPGHPLPLLYDVSHNTCKEELHEADGERKNLFVHRKGATRALPPQHPALPDALKPLGQPVLVGGSMGTCSYILLGTAGENQAFSSACHGGGRAMSRHAATKTWRGEEIVNTLRQRGIIVKSPSMRGVAEEAPEAYKDISKVVDCAQGAGLCQKVARLKPLICIKG